MTCLGPQACARAVVVAVAGEITAGGNGRKFNGVLRHSETVENGLGKGYNGRTVGALVPRESIPCSKHLGRTRSSRAVLIRFGRSPKIIKQMQETLFHYRFKFLFVK